jgi:TonB family protein
MSQFRRGKTRVLTKPRVRKKEYRERFSLLLLLSLLIHATLIILLALFVTKRASEKTHTPPEPPMPEVTLQLPPPDKERPFVEAKESADKAPEKAPFQSDENTKAASELPVTGSTPLPSQQGVIQTALELQTQQYTPGEKPTSSAGNPAPPQAATHPEKEAAKAQSQPTATPAPSSTPESSATPQPTPDTPPPPNSLKLLELPKEQPTPQPHSPETESTAAAHKPQPPTRPNTPGTQGPTKGYQPETRQTVVYGSISNRGRSSVSAEATPLGRYKKKVTTAIGSRWYYYVNERMGLLSIGTVSVSFKVTESGAVKDLRVLSSNSNSSLTDCTLRSIMDAKIPPIPPDVAGTLQNGCIEIDYSFTIY